MERAGLQASEREPAGAGIWQWTPATRSLVVSAELVVGVKGQSAGVLGRVALMAGRLLCERASLRLEQQLIEGAANMRGLLGQVRDLLCLELDLCLNQAVQ